jgi:methylmalonyl-CoA/ethylmalonyl-CoA epimerase
MTFHHLGVACRDLRETIASFCRLHEGAQAGPLVFDPEQNATLCLVNAADGVTMEFISGPQVEKLVNKGVSYYHVCYETSELEQKIAALVELGALLVSPPKPAVLFNGRRVAFLHLPYGLIELIETAEN